jgi:hypothetical protein
MFNDNIQKARNNIYNLATKYNEYGVNKVIYSIPSKFEFPDYAPDSKVLRFLYYNVVSLLIFNDYISKLDDIYKVVLLEFDAKYGNTKLPLIKVDTGMLNPVNYLPFPSEMNEKLQVPVMGVKMNESILKGYKEVTHLSFYINTLSFENSNTEDKDIKYLNIQMRTKSDKQYAADVQGLKTLKAIKRDYNLN